MDLEELWGFYKLSVHAVLIKDTKWNPDPEFHISLHNR